MTRTKHENVVNDRTNVVYIKNETKLCVKSNLVQSVMKTIWDNDYAEIKTELSRPIWPSALCDEN